MSQIGESRAARHNPYGFQNWSGLPYRFVHGHWQIHWQRLVSLGFRGNIVGPRGSGKSTLLRQLSTELKKAGRHSRFMRARELNSECHDNKGAFWAAWAPETILLVDSAEQIPFWTWRRVRRLAQANGRGFVGTMHHARLDWPTWVHTKTTPELVGDLAVELNSEACNRSLGEWRRRWNARRGNVRDIWSDLYEEWAQRPVV